jgi:alpha-tubulin suppressor-like RCC1 family protein
MCGLLALLALLSAGCGRTMRWEYSMPSTFDGSMMVARVRAGSCEGTTVLFEREFIDGESAGDGPVLSPGDYAVEIAVRGTDCDIVARGCEEVTLPGADVIHVTITAITPVDACSPDRCMDGVCEMLDGGIDASMIDVDAGTSDVPPSDTPAPDVGVGDECTIAADCPCGPDVCTGGRCIPSRPATVLEAGDEHVCAIAGGRLFCWGRSGVGQVGVAWNTVTRIPTRIGPASDWTDVSSLGDHTCGIQGGGVRCWGSNYTRQCGVDIATYPNVLNGPVAVALPIAPARVAVGSLHSFALDATGMLAGWGRNSQAQVGGEANITNPLPQTVLLDTWLDVSAGEFFSCSIDSSHALWCRGASFSGSLGNDGRCSDCGPVQVVDPNGAMPGPEWARVELGLRHACAWDTAGVLYCWGRADGASVGALGVGEPPPSMVPTPSLLSGYTVAAASLSNHTCIVETSGALWCFGPNGSGQLGVGDQATRFEPARVEGSGWTDVTTGGSFTCGLRGSGAVFCWGTVLGQTDLELEDGEEIETTPVRICIP